MVEQQLVDYIKAQLKVGVSRDAIGDALAGIGWPTADIDDSLKATEGEAAASAFKAVPIVPAEKSTIAVNDLIPDSKLEMFKASPEKKVPPTETAKPVQMQILPEQKVAVRSGFNKWLIIVIVVAVLAVAAAGGTVYFYSQTKSLQDKIAALASDSNTAQSKISDLNSQVASLNKSGEDLKAQIANLSGENRGLKDELSFFVIPSEATGSVAFSLKGMLDGGGKNPYTVTTANGLKVSVANSKDAKVDLVLKPLVSNTVEVSGTHAPASRSVTITSVNGAPIQ